MPSPRSERLTVTYQNQLLRLRLLATAAALRAFDRLGSYNSPDADRFGEHMAPITQASTNQAIAITDAYLAAWLTEELEEPTTVVGLTLGPVRPVSPQEVYRRAFIQAWGMLTRGVPYDQAIAAARARTAQTVVTDIQLAARNAAHDVLGTVEQVTGWRRRLGGGKHCPLCVSASTRDYSRSDLMPIHPHCGCSVQPIIGEAPIAPVGRRIDDKVEVVQHGELGPVLWDSSHDFTGDIAA